MPLRMVRRLPYVRWIYVYESLLDGVLSSRWQPFTYLFMRINLYFREEGDGGKARHNCPPPSNGQDICPWMICRKEEWIRETEPD